MDSDTEPRADLITENKLHSLSGKGHSQNGPLKWSSLEGDGPEDDVQKCWGKQNLEWVFESQLFLTIPSTLQGCDLDGCSAVALDASKFKTVIGHLPSQKSDL